MSVAGLSSTNRRIWNSCRPKLFFLQSFTGNIRSGRVCSDEASFLQQRNANTLLTMTRHLLSKLLLGGYLYALMLTLVLSLSGIAIAQAPFVYVAHPPQSPAGAPRQPIAAPQRLPVPAGDPPPSWTSGCANCDSPLPLWNNATATSGCLACRGGCTPGQTACAPCTAHTRIGRFACGIYRALCCPDPCYDPKWNPIADAAFFTEAVRPVTQQRFRWEAGLGMVYADRAEYFWARADGTIGPAPTRALDYHDLSMYTETSSGKFSFFINQPYRSIYPSAPWHGAGFAPMDLGTKTLIFDCELLQIAFQFRTYLPIGNTRKGLGNGHTSLEPSLIAGLSLSPKMYVHGQLGEWIPIAGDPDYAGAILHYHLSVNRVLFRMLPDVPVIGTLEMNGWSFQDGAYTDPVHGMQSASGTTYFSLGPGVRMSVCDKIDFGIGSAFSLTSANFADQMFRTEFRIRY